MPTLVEKMQERGRLAEAMHKIQEKIDAEGRGWTAEEEQEFERLDGEQERLGKEIRHAERLKTVTAALKETTDSGLRPSPGTPERRNRFIANPRSTQDYEKVFRNYLLDGPSTLAAMSPELRNTLQMDEFTKGGALVAPDQFVKELIKAVDDQVFIRQWATTHTVTSAAALGVPTLDADPADADWTSELGTGSEGTMAFGKRELRPHPLAKRIKVSNKLMRASAIEPERLVRDRLAYKEGVTQEKAFLTGDGSQKPLGVFTASDDGIPTSRDVSADNTATAVTADGLINAKYTLKAPYWARARWIVSRELAKQIRKLKDGNGNYIWAPGLTGGTPDTILDFPYAVSEYAPATFTTGLYVAVVGDFSNYWIVDALDMTVQRLVELYAETNQTGFIGRAEVDGAPVLAEAFVRVKLG